VNLDLAAPLASMLSTEGWGSIRGGRAPDNLHASIDLRAAVGTPVRAVSNGTVIFGGQYADGSGGAVELNHQDGMITRALHLSRVDVKTGQHVSVGQQIGLSGAPPRSPNLPHVHFDAWVAMPMLPQYVGRFGLPTGGFQQSKVWGNTLYYKVPVEPLAPMSYQADVVDLAKRYNVKLYSPVRSLLVLGALGVTGLFIYLYLARTRTRTSTEIETT
jgi:murein DD-endopeptidase MepM/ murein hydrolase activator NlpD